MPRTVTLEISDEQHRSIAAALGVEEVSTPKLQAVIEGVVARYGWGEYLDPADFDTEDESTNVECKECKAPFEPASIPFPLTKETLGLCENCIINHQKSNQ